MASLLLFITGVFLIFLLSWKVNPNVGEFTFLPDWLIEWADDHHNNRMRTAIPFIALGLLTGLFLVYAKKQRWRFWIYTWAILVLIVSIAEVGQYFIPSRQPDLKDALWGALGGGLGLLLPLAVRKLL